MNHATESSALARLLEPALLDPRCGWSLGTFGAIAEFLRDREELVTFDHGLGLTAVTPRGGLRIEPDPRVRAVAYEAPSALAAGWSHAVALCLPPEAAAMAGRAKLTELGPDEGALRVEDRRAVLFDLGLEAPQVDLCVRSGDPAVVARLREGCGRSLLEPDNPLMGLMPGLGPHRVFLCRFGRIEVFQPIPGPGGSSPEGPHTHVLPKLLRQGRTHAATVPLPAGLVPCMHLYPPHPLQDALGRPTAFDRQAHAAFQAMLGSFGDSEALELKRRVTQAVRQGLPPAGLALPDSRAARATVRVALRQLAHLDPPAHLAAWRALHDRQPAEPGGEAGAAH